MSNGLARWAPLLVALLCAAPAAAQRAAPEGAPADAISDSIQQLFNSLWVPKSRFTDSPHLREAFRPVVAEVRKATVEVRLRGKRVAYGGIVGPDGWIVTKASLVQGPVSCRLKDGREFDARLVGIDRDADLAMLKVAAKGLPTLDLTGRTSLEATQVVALRTEGPADVAAPAASAANADPLQAGDWLATVGLRRDPIAVGVVSVLPRLIEKRPGFLGVGIDLEYVAPEGKGRGVRIQSVSPDSAAEDAGVLPADFILAVEDRPTGTPQELKDAIALHHPGDRIGLEILRGEEKRHLQAVLRSWAPNQAERRAYYQNNLGGQLSERRFGFPSALQHDTTLDPDDCGGPVVDLNGRVVAFNIARAGRTETYALPVSEVRSRLFDLMSGRLTPVGEAD